MGKSTGSRMAGMCQLRGQAAEESHAGTLVPGGHGEEQPGGRRRGAACWRSCCGLHQGGHRDGPFLQKHEPTRGLGMHREDLSQD